MEDNANHHNLNRLLRSNAYGDVSIPSYLSRMSLVDEW